MSAMVSAT